MPTLNLNGADPTCCLITPSYPRLDFEILSRDLISESRRIRFSSDTQLLMGMGETQPANAFDDLMSLMLLQFPLNIASSCGLHRSQSQDIHR